MRIPKPDHFCIELSGGGSGSSTVTAIDVLRPHRSFSLKPLSIKRVHVVLVIYASVIVGAAATRGGTSPTTHIDDNEWKATARGAKTIISLPSYKAARRVVSFGRRRCKPAGISIARNEKTGNFRRSCCNRVVKYFLAMQEHKLVACIAHTVLAM